MKTTWLKPYAACDEARHWLRYQRGTLQDAWDRCDRADWMLWLLGKEGMCDRRTLVLTACACARTALVHVPEGEQRPRKAIETAEAWARGDATIEEVLGAAHAAHAANAANAYAYAAYYAANDAASVHYAASASVHAANAYAYANASAAYAYMASLREQAAIVRQHVPHPPELAVQLSRGER